MNKFITLLIVFTFAAASLTTIAADKNYTTSKNKVVSLEPFDFLFNGRINATFETKMGASNSLTINGSYWDLSKYWSAFGLGASYRWYLDPFEEGKKALNGLSVGPRIDFFFWTYDYSSVISGHKSETSSSFAIGGEVNYKWAFGDGGKWVIEPTLKLMFPVRKADGLSGYSSYGFGVNLGYAF